LKAAVAYVIQVQHYYCKSRLSCSLTLSPLLPHDGLRTVLWQAQHST